MSQPRHSEYCTLESCSTFCEVRRAEFAAGIDAAKRAAIRDVVEQLGPHASLYFLEQAGWPAPAIEAAVRRGDVVWTAAGILQTRED